MKLHELFARIRPMFEGKASPADTARALYGSLDDRNAQRLEIYHFPERARIELSTAVPVTAQALASAWGPLADAYFAEAPWGSFLYEPGGEAFARFLAARDDVPRWVVALADFEWRMYQLANTPNESSAWRLGPLRLPAGTEVVHYDFDLLTWLVTAPIDEPPAAAPCDILFCRSGAEQASFRRVGPLELRVLDAIRDGVPLEPAAVGAEPLDVARSIRRLLRDGAILGDGMPAIEELVGLADAPPTAPVREIDLSRPLVLAPFAQLRWHRGEALLWSPMTPDVIAADDMRLADLAGRFAVPRLADDVVAELADSLSTDDAVDVILALAAAGILLPETAPEHRAAAHGWDFYDAGFHARSRDEDPLAEIRIIDATEGPPAVKPPIAETMVELLSPATAIGDLTTLLAARRATPRVRPGPIELSSLSSLLGLAARGRPYASAGDSRSLELYPIVASDGVTDLAPGVYHYREDAHQLERVLSDDNVIDSIASGAERALAIDLRPRVVIKVTSRIERVFQRYPGSAYAMALHEAGALAQTLALVGAGLGLALVSVPARPDRAFERIRGIDPWAEPTVAELIVSATVASTLAG